MRDRLTQIATAGTAFPGSAAAFWRDIHRISEAAHRQVTRPGISLCGAQKAIGEIDDIASMIGRMTAFAANLMKAENKLSRPRSEEPRNEPWVDQCWEAVKNDPPHLIHGKGNETLTESMFRSEFIERADEILMENLTAAWLGLYFLGVPFIHPWENVLRIAAERGGFPSGVCITKYVGDVYRSARMEMASMVQEPEAPQPQHDALLVLSYQPSAMLRGLLTCPEDDSRTPSDLHRLGWCYLVLQLRLYIKEGFPIKYFIPLDALRKSWDKLAHVNDPDNRAKMMTEISEWFLDIMFVDADREKQEVKLLVKSDATSGIPTCILGRQIGIYTLNNSQSHVHFGGNHIRDALLASYRSKLERLRHRNIISCFIGPPEVTTDGYDLLKMDRIELRQLLAYFLDRTTAASTTPVHA